MESFANACPPLWLRYQCTLVSFFALLRSLSRRPRLVLPFASFVAEGDNDFSRAVDVACSRSLCLDTSALSTSQSLGMDSIARTKVDRSIALLGDKDDPVPGCRPESAVLEGSRPDCAKSTLTRPRLSAMPHAKASLPLSTFLPPARRCLELCVSAAGQVRSWPAAPAPAACPRGCWGMTSRVTSTN